METYKISIYKLQCSDGYFYIGSSKNVLRARLQQHKSKSTKYPERQVYKHILQIGWDNVKIVLVRDCMVCDKREQIREEDKDIQQCIKNKYCLNFRRALLSDEERIEFFNTYYKFYRETHKDNQKEYNRKYRENQKKIKNNTIKFITEITNHKY